MARAIGLGIIAGVMIVAGAAPAAMQWSDAAPLNINAAVDDDQRDYYLSLAHDGAGNWVCVWCAGVGSGGDRDFDIWLARSADDGETWGAPARLDPFADAPPEQEFEDDFHPFVVTDRAGHWVAAWYTHDNHGGTIGDDTDLLVSRSADNGATWTSSVPLNSDAEIDSNGDGSPSLATDCNGHWMAIWSKQISDGGDYDLYLSRSTDTGQTWSPMALLHPAMGNDPGYDGSPSIATDEAGHWVVVWTSDNIIDPNGLINTNGTGDDDIFVSRSTDAGVTWSAPATLNSTAAGDTLDDRRPRIATDKAGRWVTVWYYGVYEIDYDIMVSYSDDNGATWSPAEYLNDNALTDVGRDLYPVPATDGNGNWVVVWQSQEPLSAPPVGTDWDIFFSYSADNAVNWSSPWFLNSYAWEILDFAYDRDPEVAYAGNGQWRTAWGSNYDLGGAIWTDYDLMISSSTLVPDGDRDTDGDVDLYDFAGFQGCFTTTGPIGSGCYIFDFDGDEDVDVGDFVVFEGSLGGPGG